ncbi:MAG: hypothetical protein U0T79_05175 [Ferruginibacter sp.]
MIDRKTITDDILALINENPLNNVDIRPVIEKHTAGMEIERQAAVRVAITGILREMKEDGDIVFAENGMGITSRQGGVFYSSSVLVRSTNKYEKAKTSNSHSIYVGGDVTGNINTGKVGGNLQQINIVNSVISEKDEEELRSWGVEQNQIEELKGIISKSQDKSTLVSKAMKWLGSVSASIAGRGLYENLPAITDFIHRLIS